MAGSYFEAFTVANVVFTAIGAAVYWGMNGRTKLRAFILRDIIDWFDINAKSRAAIEFLIFLVIGCLIGIAVTEPVNAIQAITAGFGWTGIFARPTTSPK